MEIPSRVVIEQVRPQVDDGRFPIKRVVGEAVEVTADIFADGHDQLEAVVRYRQIAGVRTGDTSWREERMSPLGNDRWSATFHVEALGRYEYTLVGWVDRFGSWQEDVRKRVAAGQAVASELLEGSAAILATASRLEASRGPKTGGQTPPPESEPEGGLRTRALAIAGSEDEARRVELALDPNLTAVMRRHSARDGAATYDRTLEVLVQRPRARFGAWYEMFPRSAGPDPTRSATFDEAACRLSDIAAMGFDVLYLPPIHPIGRSFRKGSNNTLAAGPGDPGSPWAIGGPEGGHKAVEPGLGTIDDFDRFVDTARRMNLEVALDLAFQCSPDHPYVTEHPEWFRHLSDGSIKYAENPPKKYQDICPLEFESEHWQELWEELKSVVLFWIGHGVSIFRVDNPHTKPLAFWEWLLREVTREHPEAIFLSEAFTRPALMKRLGKVGFSQSYTYFTWRNTKAELTEYFTELTSTDVREYMRPNLFANTPDILHAYLQEGGRPAFQVRLVLATTLGASYGIYSGFEVCENRAVPGTEEYHDSEKYQFRRWDWNRPGHIRELIACVNRARRTHPALQRDWQLRFHTTDNDQLLCYSKALPDRSDIVLVVVNLDPHHVQDGWVQVPVWDWGTSSPYVVHDLLDDAQYAWRGDWNYVRLDPDVRAAHIFHVQRVGWNA